MSPPVKAHITNWEITCGGCPTIIEGTDSLTGEKVYYRLRHGYWRVNWATGPNEGTRIAEDVAPDLIDGVATVDEVRSMIAPHNIILGDA